jgi:hypothetical protein
MAACFSELRKVGDEFWKIQNPVSLEIKKQRSKVIGFFNHYELVAIGCNGGIHDKKFIRHTCGIPLFWIGKQLKPFVE